MKELESKITDALKTVFDPEIPVNIYDLGLVYDIRISPCGAVDIVMTLTSPACPVAEQIPPEVEMTVRAVPGVTATKVELVWDPPWNPDMMSEAARLQLNL
ncbi:MAG: DUF59 domain-containing protein [Candidatus Latescibacteria bacterium]|nr:DUF59 domain-containing protein [Candidatus Latescibacterota bacterium]NIM21740.1 DUF59 domain-containing protein [Candidatus Latescibacterota bacterium]NIM65878.1 DUF59 domain-containing protein [Candidatus Latescibacterota bacterium]NIO02623.1 DUF59 domain-containing protein [Candidatus Latescibacterota bacterium]NIO29604.1 DUF59 domain-containing protein [Candidatus Latescibacterota bacterium]